jgi:hypothetical protein
LYYMYIANKMMVQINKLAAAKILYKVNYATKLFNPFYFYFKFFK